MTKGSNVRAYLEDRQANGDEGAFNAEDFLDSLARAILSLADTAGMPDTFWQTDWRTTLAREALGVPEDGRYSHAHIWMVERG